MHNNHPIEMSSNSSTKYEPTYDNVLLVKFRKLKTYNIFLGVALVISILVIVVLLGIHVTKSKQPYPQTTSPSVCTTMQCSSVAATVYNAMDMSIDPCHDFYHYSCGNWLQKTPIPDSRSRYSRFGELTDKNVALLKRSLQEIVEKKAKPSNDAIRKVADYYKSCMDKANIISKGDAPLKKMIADFGSWPITNSNFDETRWNFTETFIMIHKGLAFSPLFSLYIGEDIKSSKKNSIIIDQPKMQLSRPNYLTNSSEYNMKVRKAYKVMMKAVVRLLGAQEKEVGMMDSLFEFERKLAEYSLSVNFRRDYKKIYKAMTVKELANATGIEQSWLLYCMNQLFTSTTKVTSEERIITYSIDYIRQAYKLFKELPPGMQATYMLWPPVRSMAMTLLGDYEKVKREFLESVSGTTEVDPRWQECMSSTTASYGFGLGSLFIEKTFTEEAKKAAEEMISGVRTVFIDNLKHLNWMDEETKRAAKEKALGIIENIGYPSFIRNATALEHYYAELDSKPSNYFDNILNRRRYYNAKNYAKRGKPVDKTVWGMYPSTVNAYYSPTENKIVFPAGILQSPFYDYNAPRALNYGAIGMVVGHEITHGFDDQGRQFDKFGNIKSWWSNYSETNFKQKSQCLVDQYSKFSLFNKSVNGNQTLGENIADNGGIKAALQAYRRYVDKHGAEDQLPGLGLSSEQLYFVGFAQVWCSAYRESAAITQIDSGYHSPSIFRVTGTLQNSNEFSKAFECKAGSRMNPINKCTLW